LSRFKFFGGPSLMSALDAEPNEYRPYDIASREIAGVQVKSVSFPAGAGEAQVSVYHPALRPPQLTWLVICLEDEGGTAFLPHCAVVPSPVVAGYLCGGAVDGKLPVTHGLTARMDVAGLSRLCCLQQSSGSRGIAWSRPPMVTLWRIEMAIDAEVGRPVV
jgi:hypothetical protein